jgi:hypothetical protein
VFTFNPANRKGCSLSWQRLILAIAVSTTIWLAQGALSAEPPSWPLQLEVRVPFEPTAFTSEGRSYLAYEIYLTNYGSKPLGLKRIDVLNAARADAAPVAAFEGARLDALLQPVGVQPPAEAGSGSHHLMAGATLVVVMWVVFDRDVPVPNELLHRITTADGKAEGAAIGTHHSELKVLGSPVQGSHWQASDGPSNDPDNHHRRGIFIVEGQPSISRRYAIDWVQLDQNATFAGDARDKRSYHAYGKVVLAVADGTVVTARNDLPDKAPGHNENFHPAVPITMDTVGGNTITLDLGGGQFAHYYHLQPGSVRGRAGDAVRKGQILAQIGSSGDAREPHLHFELTTSPKPLAGEGVPYAINRYRVMTEEKYGRTSTQELPLRGMVIDFGQISH